MLQCNYHVTGCHDAFWNIAFLASNVSSELSTFGDIRILEFRIMDTQTLLVKLRIILNFKEPWATMSWSDTAHKSKKGIHVIGWSAINQHILLFSQISSDFYISPQIEHQWLMNLRSSFIPCTGSNFASFFYIYNDHKTWTNLIYKQLKEFFSF